MAISYESIQSQTDDGSATITITKPTSLAVGDLMVAFIGSGQDATTNSSLAGWTEVDGVADASFWGANPGNNTCLAKVADSGDTAASNFTFTKGGGNDESVGAILRFSSDVGSFDIDNLIVSDAQAAAGNPTITFVGGVTPVGGSSYLVMGVFTDNASTSTGWAVATDDPSWTEVLDLQISASSDATLSIAYGSRTETSATGNYSTILDSNYEGLGILLAINEMVDVTISPDPLVMTSAVPAVAVTGGATVSPSPLVITSSVPEVTVTVTTVSWTNESRPPASVWTIEDQT